ncbi:MAG: ABC transporter permease [Planctomycetes bacterium]|nr:ABC transporter permease [Planctomycetota bacterium]MBM4083480.1 ABC transporter permease [Planctomycetota bacterium]
MATVLERIGRHIIRLCEVSGDMLVLAGQATYWMREAWWARTRVLAQMARAGSDTLGIASLNAIFVGMAIALQTGDTLRRFGMEESLGDIVSLAMCRELGPVLTALLVSGRVGAGIAAELATMNVGEEIDALRTLGINPVRYLVMPRFFACVTMLPLLVIYVNLVGILAGGFMTSSYFDVAFSNYMDHVIKALDFEDIFRGLVKAFFFGGIIGIVGCQRGLRSSGGPEGVGRATTEAVVISFVTIYVFNYFITWFQI